LLLGGNRLRRNATHGVPSRPAKRRQECRNSTRAARLAPI
jgi:hypothetical protein